MAFIACEAQFRSVSDRGRRAGVVAWYTHIVSVARLAEGDERESSGTTALAISRDMDIINPAEPAERLLEAILGGLSSHEPAKNERKTCSCSAGLKDQPRNTAGRPALLASRSLVRSATHDAPSSLCCQCTASLARHPQPAVEDRRSHLHLRLRQAVGLRRSRGLFRGRRHLPGPSPATAHDRPSQVRFSTYPARR